MHNLKVSAFKVRTRLPPVYKRHFLKRKQAKTALEEFSEKIKVSAKELFGSKPRVELVEAEVAEIFVVNGKPLLARYKNVFFPTLYFDKALAVLPKILIDMGAVPHVCNGADVMAPGVVDVEGEFDENNVILVVDERHRKPLAVAITLCNSENMKKLEHGKVAKNIHFVGDKLWKTLKDI